MLPLDEIISDIQKHQQPNKVIIYDDENSNIFSFLGKYPSARNDEPLVYVCQNFSCQLPTSDINKIKNMLK